MGSKRGCGDLIRVRDVDTIVATGRVYLGDTHVTKTALAARLPRKRIRPEVSFSTDVLVWGRFSVRQVASPKAGLTRNLEAAWLMRTQGHHVHVIGTEDLSGFLAGSGSPCRSLPSPDALLAELRRQARRKTAAGPTEATDGFTSYRPATSSLRADLISLQSDLAALERAHEGHRRTEAALAAAVAKHGLRPLSAVAEPRCDLAWRRPDGALVIAEVKSLTDVNEVQQLRLGIGQVLHYRTQHGGQTVAVLAVERRPRAPRIWEQLCEEVGVTLVWPSVFERCFT